VTSPSLRLIDDFQGHTKAPKFLEDQILARGAHAVADLGGGANPTASKAFVDANGIDYTIIDISAAELAKAPAGYNRVCANIMADTLPDVVGRDKYDLVFSHMFIEHLKDAETAHRNIFSLLKPGGVAIHLFPTPTNLPLFMNRLLPQWASSILTRIIQPGRDHHGHQVKFPAYYRLCGPPSARLRKKFEQLGFIVEQHVGYVGHNYYDVVPWVSAVEKSIRPILVRNNIAMASDAMLVLRKPA
jgi:SAM-dependent methyltransferase